MFPVPDVQSRRNVRSGSKAPFLLPTRERMSFETVTAAVDFAKTKLPEAYRTNATIMAAGVTLYWGDIERWGQAVVTGSAQ
jgi:hypothetical protein